MDDRLQSADNSFLTDPYIAERRRQHRARLQQLIADQEWATSHEWVRWLSGTDAQVLLLELCHCLSQGDVPLATLRTMVEGWRANALRAIEADNWQAEVDAFLEVSVDARLALQSRGAL